uniref:Retrotransposon Copia-like N-terminal domain-containing protein n=1 Tax=Cannabis sativa TaxID=3483 RepID=A0A803NZX3_CANSA
MSTGEQTPSAGSQVDRSAPHPTQTNSNVAAQSSNTAMGASSSSVVVPQFGSTLNQPFALKLDRNNFSLWKTMVSAIVKGHRLDGYLTGKKVKPQEFISTPNLDGQPGFGVEMNPEYEQWVVHDQLLMGWLYGSMTETIATEVMGCSTSTDLWRALEALYGAHSKAKMDEYRTKIQTVNKGSQSMVEYLRQKRQWADVLALAGASYPEQQRNL